jgi:uncharacterized protein YoxC
LSDTKEIVEFLKDEVGDVTNTVGDLTEEVDELAKEVDELADDLVEQKSAIFSEMDGDYYDMKDYVKRRIQRHVHHYHTPSHAAAEPTTDAISMIVSEYSEEAVDAAYVSADALAADAEAAAEDENVIIMDDTCFISDDDE